MIPSLVLIALLVTLYMARPRFQRFELSSAAFFRELPAPRERRFRFQWSRPETNRAFWLQAAVLLAVLLAFLLRERFYTSLRAGEGQGVWVLVDTSASMDTVQAGEPRHRRVADAIREAVDEGEDVPRRFRLSLFDLELREVALADPTLDAVLAASDRWRPRALGTDLQLLRALPPPGDTPITHVLVITDRPAPDWTETVEQPRIVWRDIGERAENIGIESLRAARNPLTGYIADLRVDVAARGLEAPPEDRVIRVEDPDGSKAERLLATWTRQDDSFRTRFTFEAQAPGRYKIELDEGGAYRWDDRAEVEVGTGRDLAVDWRLPDRAVPDALGWRQEDKAPQFRVTAAQDNGSDDRSDVPTLRVMAGTAAPERGEIRDFEEGHPLLRDVNLDAVELLALPAVETDELRPVLRRVDGKVWLAAREDPPAFLIPGLPALRFDPADAEEALKLTLFFNAVRELLADHPAAPLYELTDPAHPEVLGTRLALHPGEGETDTLAKSVGGLGRLEADLPEESRPFWPLAIFAALGVLAVERGLAAWAGPKWRA